MSAPKPYRAALARLPATLAAAAELAQLAVGSRPARTATCSPSPTPTPTPSNPPAPSDPLPLLADASFMIEESERFKAGIVERLVAIKPTGD